MSYFLKATRGGLAALPGLRCRRARPRRKARERIVAVLVCLLLGGAFARGAPASCWPASRTSFRRSDAANLAISGCCLCNSSFLGVVESRAGTMPIRGRSTVPGAHRAQAGKEA